MVLLLVPTIYQWIQPRKPYKPYAGVVDSYDPGMDSINSIASLVGYWDSLSRKIGIDKQAQPRQHISILDSLVRKKFFHGIAEYDYSDNFLAALFGSLLWKHLSAMVIPDDIISVNKAMCSQQAIVFQAALQQRGYQTRSVLLKDHFCSEIKYGTGWHFYDTNMEPVFPDDSEVPGLDELMADRRLIERAYGNNPWKERNAAYKYFVKGSVRYLPVDDFPADNMLLCHQVLKLLSHIGWMIPLAISVLFVKSKSA